MACRNPRLDLYDPKTLAVMDLAFAAIWKVIKADDPFRDYAKDGELRIVVGAKLPNFKYEILSLVIFLLCTVLGPLLVFAPQLTAARRRGLREYGTVAERYVREFDAKWLRGGASTNERLMGSADIQSLADLANSYEVVRTMSFAPFSKGAILQLAALTLAPIVPLLLTMMPLEELLKSLVGILF